MTRGRAKTHLSSESSQAQLAMQLNTSQLVDIRTCGVNLNHWYVVARSCEVTNQPIGVSLWHLPIVLYRDGTGTVRGLEDRCPHRQVRLSSGQVVEGHLECVYHGWQFNGEGECSHVPYLESKQKRPSCRLRVYPVREQDGFIWLFPGEADPNSVKLLGLTEWDHLNYIGTVSTIDVKGHYSYLIENLMDMYHGHLHEDYQAWASAALQDLDESDARVDAHYEAQSYYKIDKIWSISQLFFPSLRRLHPEPLDVSYIYPHWASTLGQDFKIYCLFCPISETHTRAYLIHFTSLNAFWRLHKLPVWFRRLIKDSLFGAAQKLLDGLVEQDVKMIEQEQQAYLANPERRNYELNRTIVSVQRLIRQQASMNL
jgi:phenylpropionate dioxygenase-like ring-hydroxylating dioxygenase large terminal subunit